MAVIRKRLPKVLFFTKGIVPSDEEIAFAEKIEANVAYRNSQQVPPSKSGLESCDAVCGYAPKQYVDRFPVVGNDGKIPAPKKGKKTSNNTDDAPANPQAIGGQQPQDWKSGAGQAKEAEKK